jgi:beta-lactamase regulating signal transducer with metallopeptidase domain
MNPSIIELAAKSSAVLAVAAIAAGLMRRRASAASRHLVWTLAVVALLVLPLAIAALPSWSIPIRQHVPLLPAVQTPAPIVFESNAAPIADGDARSGNAPQPATVAPLASMAVLPIVYAAGVVFLLGRLGVDYWRSRRVLSRSTMVTDAEWTSLLGECVADLGLRRAVRLVRSREEVMPMTSGVRRPAIVIPSVADTWEDDRRRAVLLHELAHVVRFDCLTQAMAEATLALYWPHPGVWWAARRLRVERELACDDCVLSSGTEPREYAGHLLEIAHSLGRHHAPALAVGMARPRQLEGRMVALLDATRNRRTPAASRRLLALASAVAVVAPLAAATLVGVPATPDVTGAPASRTASAAVGVATAAAQNPASAPTTLAGGTWQIRLASDGRSAHLTVSIAPNSSYGTTILLDRIDGLAAILTGPGGPGHYALKRDAGTFDFEGVVRAGSGGGTFSFTPDAAFGGELVRRGFARPTALELGMLAWSDIGFAFLDELNALKYERPTLPQLVNGAKHGVSRAYVREMSELGYRVGTIDALVRLRDHGVDATFVRGMQAEGFKSLSVDDLVLSRNHGIDPTYIRDLRGLGYGLNLNQLVDARNHGIDPGYVRDMRAVGLATLSLDDLINARNHGVDPGFVREFRDLGYQLTLDQLVNARNYGVDPGFVKEMAGAGYEHLSMAELIKLRNHGVNGKTVEQLKRRGVDHPSIDRLIELRNRGASANPASVPPSLQASGSFRASVKVVVRDVTAVVERWADRWLR